MPPLPARHRQRPTTDERFALQRESTPRSTRRTGGALPIARRIASRCVRRSLGLWSWSDALDARSQDVRSPCGCGRPALRRKAGARVTTRAAQPFDRSAPRSRLDGDRARGTSRGLRLSRSGFGRIGQVSTSSRACTTCRVATAADCERRNRHRRLAQSVVVASLIGAFVCDALRAAEGSRRLRGPLHAD